MLDDIVPEDGFIVYDLRILPVSQNLKRLGPICVGIHLDHLIHQASETLSQWYDIICYQVHTLTIYALLKISDRNLFFQMKDMYHALFLIWLHRVGLILISS